MSDEQDREVERICAEYEAGKRRTAHLALAILGIATRCANTDAGGCAAEFGSMDVAELTRCLDCGLWFHAHCARKHFAGSGAEKDKYILEMENLRVEAATVWDVFVAAKTALAHRRSPGYFTAAGQTEQSRLDIAVDEAVDAALKAASP